MSYVERVLTSLGDRYPHQPVFLQAVKEVLTSIQPALDRKKDYEKYKILERITEPELVQKKIVHLFRVVHRVN